MSKHVFTISSPAQKTPSTALPDGAITGNGDVTAVLAGTADRIRLYIGKADFWKADGRVYVPELGGLAPLGLVEILLPHLAYADYRAEQNVDEAFIRLHLQEGKLSADLTVTVCAEDNTVLLELERTHPVLSASISLLPLEGSGATVSLGREEDVRYSIRGFEDPEFRFPCYGICALREVSRCVRNGRERILWAITVCTNHDSAAYKAQAIEKAASLDEADCARLLAGHAAWWTNFWSKSGVELPDKELERYWYGSLYAIACCARNKKFPPGLWGAYSTADGMGWFGDYHLNYNYEAPFYPLTVCNHTELMECYATPLNDFLPQAKRFAKEYLGVSGSYFPVGIGPLGMETDYRPDTKEHGHLFLGQKSNGSYAAVIPMMHWYGTRDTEFARREYYPFLLSVAQFWENYLVFEDGAYHIYNDALNECGWYSGPDYMPQGHDDKDPIVSQGLVRMLMKLMIDLSTELGENGEKIPVWQHILDHLPQPDCGASPAAPNSGSWPWNACIPWARSDGPPPRSCSGWQETPTGSWPSGTATTGSAPITPWPPGWDIPPERSRPTSTKSLKSTACPTACSVSRAAVWKTPRPSPPPCVKCSCKAMRASSACSRCGTRTPNSTACGPTAPLSSTAAGKMAASPPGSSVKRAIL